MTNRRRHRLSLVLGALLIANVTVACVPVATQPPPPPPPSCSGQGGEVPLDPTPTPSEPVDYVALVDEPGAGTPEVVTFSATSDAEVDAVVADLEEAGEVLVVEPDQTVTALAVDPNDDPYYSTPSPGLYGLKPSASDFETAWATATGAGITIAIVDSGVLATHEDFTPNAGKLDLVNDWDFVADTNDAGIDPYGHGTHVAGIAAARDNAVGVIGGAPDATILPIRVLDGSGNGQMSNVVLGVNYAVSHGVDVINLSLGSGTCSGALDVAIQAAIDDGVVVVAAAGNCGTVRAGCAIANQPTYPGATGVTDLIAAGATTQANVRASFSNSNSYVDLGAPGNQIWSTYKDSASSYGQLSGTSMATPHVAAAAALVLQACPGLTPAQVKASLVSTALPVGGGGVGQGLLQADLAVVDADCGPR